MLKQTSHISVMPDESLQYLQVDKGGVFLDCTLGGGGHSRKILSANTANIVYAGDRDSNAIERSVQITAEYPNRFIAKKCSFSEIGLLFKDQKFNGVLADLGISSDHLAENRGFSFQDDSLDMRMDKDSQITAADIVNNFSVSELCSLLRRGGVRTNVKQIADSIIKHRPFNNARSLADAINKAARSRSDKKLNPATVAFQAIRIEVNNELAEIKRLLDTIPSIVVVGARLVIISFHSLEDKIVAGTMRNWSREDQIPAFWANNNLRSKGALGRLLTKKAIMPGEKEVENNSRARSARLRCFEFFGE